MSSEPLRSDEFLPVSNGNAKIVVWNRSAVAETDVNLEFVVDANHRKQRKESQLAARGGQLDDTDVEESEESCFICLDALESEAKEPCTALPCRNDRCRLKKVHAKCIYEWRQASRQGSKEEGEDASCPLCRGELAEFSYFPPDLIGSAKFDDLEERRKFLTSPVSPQAGFVRCFIRLNHLPKNGSMTSSKVLSYDSKNHPGAKVDVGVYELFLQAPTTLKYPLGPIPDHRSPKQGDALLAFGTRTRYPRPGVKRGHGMDKMSKNDLYTPVSQIDLYMTNEAFQTNISSVPENYIATVKSSFSGFKHEVLLPLEPPRMDEKGVQVSPLAYEETCCVHFIQNRHCVKNTSAPGPRKIQVCLPKVKKSEDSRIEKEILEQQEEQEACITPLQNVQRRIPSTLSHALTYKSLNMAYEGVLPGEFTFGRNKEPYWLESLKAYSLDFKGRVTMPSNKNFQLIVELDEEQRKCELVRMGSENVVPELMRDKLSAKGEAEQDHIALQFGKVGEDFQGEVFSMDFRWPLTPLQAFGICLGACDRNLTVV